MTPLVYIALGVLLINLLYYFVFMYFGWSKNPAPQTSKVYPVSLVVCAKNEAENLEKNIPIWLTQSHPDFELVLIDDASTDSTAAIIDRFSKQDPRITPVYVKANERFHNSKKYALTLGIKKAKNTRMVFTDADCVPDSTNWLSTMSQYFSAEKQLVLGFGGYKKRFGLLNALIRFETFTTALQYFSYAHAGRPYMGVGRNLGYTKILFEEQKGFASHIKIQSGDDDLFVNQAANSQNTTYCLNPESFTTSEPKTSFSSWVAQKRRHISTAKHYKSFFKTALGLYYLGNLSFWIVLILLAITNIQYALIFFGLRTLIQWLSYLGTGKKLKALDLVIAAPVLELFLICFQMSIFISNLLSPKPTWK
ncbi:glycosyltransferase [Gilvibacter sp.]|uniref:glycosyltransferase n=1 Tax=Gilvibacter sp. TaxID=2729997 RepID=UPI003F4A4833